MNISVVDNHNDVFDIWKASGITDATLVHVDAHPDMLWQADSEKMLSQHIDIASFILPAYYAWIISSILWINPQAREDPKVKNEVQF